MLDLKIAIPPLPEQQRIVGILDEAFDGIAIAKANAEKNLRNARALFESHLQTVFTQRGLYPTRYPFPPAEVRALGGTRRTQEWNAALSSPEQMAAS